MKSPGVVIARAVIKIYQKLISPDHGRLSFLFPYGYCRFNPTCSVYVDQAISRYGLIRGSYKGLKRLLRCHPWNLGGNDPLI